MMIATLVCLLFACLAVTVTACFVKNKFLPQTLSLIFLICLGVVATSFRSEFDVFSILLILSVVPLFLATYENKDNPKYPPLLKGVAYTLSAVCLTFCGLHLGQETFYGAVLGLALAFALTFLEMIIRKTPPNKENLWQIFCNALTYLGAGLLLGTLLPVLLYSTSLVNILFAVGAILYAFHILLQQCFKSKFNHLLLCLSVLVLLSTVIV